MSAGKNPKGDASKHPSNTIIKSKVTGHQAPNRDGTSEKSGFIYFHSLTVRNVRCFGDTPQTLNLSAKDGESWAPWTIILGNNGSGKSTLLQLLGCVSIRPYQPFGVDQYFAVFDSWLPIEQPFLRESLRESLPTTIVGQESISEAQIAILVASDEPANEHIHVATVQTQFVDFQNGTSSHGGRLKLSKVAVVLAGYGAWRRLGWPTLSKAPGVQCSTSHLFDANVELTDAEEWLLRLDYSVSKSKAKIATELTDRFNLVRTTLLNLLPEVTDIKISLPTSELPDPRLLFTTAYGDVQIRQLGFGYQSLISWVVDFAARMFATYPHSPNPLAEPAVCLVDEIDLHLHPSWQRRVMKYLSERFPRTQFIATAHSPLIVQSAPEVDANIVVLRQEGDHVVISNNPIDVKGWRADQILSSELFDEQPLRSPEIQAAVDERTQLLSKPKLTAKDKRRLQELESIVEQFPVGSSAEDRSVMEQLKSAAALLERVTSSKP